MIHEKIRRNNKMRVRERIANNTNRVCWRLGQTKVVQERQQVDGVAGFNGCRYLNTSMGEKNIKTCLL